ncbi:hypothetical protein KR093_010378 [Drosophila rubida]|uniref:Uncharacterized protein n=1 Tax=Drosophila rubida TaxID=30044 RepID=A0AAD4KFD3_9MUSC|nr:hypothetical protein KR093_010378 [Drosophila rubida]
MKFTILSLLVLVLVAACLMSPTYAGETTEAVEARGKQKDETCDYAALNQATNKICSLVNKDGWLQSQFLLVKGLTAIAAKICNAVVGLTVANLKCGCGIAQ